MTIYLADGLAREARRRAKRAKQSLSAYVASLLQRQVERPSWPASFRDVLDSGDGDIEEPSDPPPEDVGTLG